VVTVAQAPASRCTMSPHWFTETTTSSTFVGQSAGFPEATAAPRAVPLTEHPDSASTAAVRTTAAARARNTRSS
jgi:hypothetical protein